MKNMNELHDLQDMKAPEQLKQRTLAAAREARRAEQQDAPQHLAPAPRRRFGMAKRILAAACAFGVIVGGTAVWQARGSEQDAGSVVAEAVAHSFGIVAYAADTGETIEARDSRIVFDVAGGGMDSPTKGFFSGCLFKVTGDNIETVSASIDKGGLYRIERLDITEADAQAIMTGGFAPVTGADDIMVQSEPEQNKWWVDASYRVENGFVEPYDPDTGYGFWAEPQPVDMAQEADAPDAWHARMDEFDGATLTVTVTFTDGVADTQTMTLHTGKLGVEYPSDESGPQLTGEVLTDEQAETQGYLYGVYAEIEE
ncbi:MAG TPA: hypothetical protein H9745_09620 [Candidatus Agathobaculum stercoravium]|nr:hypothetical protein [Candidatus Agathobaculum stercoravium]